MKLGWPHFQYFGACCSVNTVHLVSGAGAFCSPDEEVLVSPFACHHFAGEHLYWILLDFFGYWTVQRLKASFYIYQVCYSLFLPPKLLRCIQSKDLLWSFVRKESYFQQWLGKPLNQKGWWQGPPCLALHMCLGSLCSLSDGIAACENSIKTCIWGLVGYLLVSDTSEMWLRYVSCL